MAPARDDGIDALFRVPPAEFVRARSALAAGLAEEGHRAEAAAVRRLRKPSVSLWAVDEVAREDRAGVRRLVVAVEALRRAHLGEPGAFTRAVDAQRAALHELVERARDLLAARGMRPSPAILARVSDTLVGAAADPQARGDLERGRLTEERKAPGFEAMTGARRGLARLRLVPPPPARAPAPRASSGTAEQRGAREAERAARQKSREAARRAAELTRVASRRRRVAQRAGARVDALRRRLADLERQADEATRAAQAAEAAAAEADASGPARAAGGIPVASYRRVLRGGRRPMSG